MSSDKKGLRAKKYATLSIISNAFLIVLKIFAGLMTGSVAIFSEAVHSLLDLMASFMAWGAIRVSGTPPDFDHPFGHGKAENLAALFEAFLIVVGGLYIVKQATGGLIEGRELPTLEIGLVVMFISSMVNYLVSRCLFKVGQAEDSPALLADAWHLRTDVYSSLGIFVALMVIHVGQLINGSWNLAFIDSLIGLVVAILIVKTGLFLGYEASTTLVDQSLTLEELELIMEHIREMYPRVYGFRRLRTRRSGPFRMVLVDLVVDGNLSVFEAHALGAVMVAGIKEHYPKIDVTFHLEPLDVKRVERHKLLKEIKQQAQSREKDDD